MKILDNLLFLLKKQDKNDSLGKLGKDWENAFFLIRNQQVKSLSLLAFSSENKDLRVTP